MGKRKPYSLHNESRVRLAEAEETHFNSAKAIAYLSNTGKT